MKIVNYNKDIRVTLVNLTRGDVFSYMSNTYVRGYQNKDTINTTRLMDGVLVPFTANSRVEPHPDATLTLNP